MVKALEMHPASAGLRPATWPPATPDKRPVTASRTDSFETLCAREKIAFSAFIWFNFGIDVGDPALRHKWPKVLNFYLRTLLKCSLMTAGGNYRFSGGEVLYVPVAAEALPPVDKPRPKLMNKQDVIDWFKTEMIPRRTDPAGTNLNRFLYAADQSNPNGLCGAAANFVFDESPAMLAGIQIGFILWQQGPVFTHIGNVILPAGFRVRRFKKSWTGEVLDETPERFGTGGLGWPSIGQLTVLDLYFKKVQTVEQWWRAVSYMGSGTLTLDNNGQFLNDAD